jgi:hypothetical protein
MKNGKNLFIYRPLSPESSSEIEEIQEQYESLIPFQRATRLGVTLLGKHAIPKTPIGRLLPILKSGPVTSQETYSMEVQDVHFMTRTREIGRTSIQLMLEDTVDNTFSAESTLFRKTAERFGGANAFKAGHPHVTIGYLEAADALDSLLAISQSMIGKNLDLLPIQSDLGPVEARQDFIKENKVPWSQLTTEERAIKAPHSTRANTGQVRTVLPGSIPGGLLGTIRTSSLEQ